MAKVLKIEHIHDGKKYHADQYMWWCKGCGHAHVFEDKETGGHHTWNKDYDNPTISPSLVANFTPGKLCHTYIVNGNVEYLGDCFHGLAGHTIELPAISYGPNFEILVDGTSKQL